MLRDLEGKTALVTGGSRGIGGGISRRLAAAGARVAVVYASNVAAAEAAVAAIAEAGGEAFAVRAELDAPGGVETAVEALGGARLDILVNNIGRAEYGNVAASTPELFDRMIGVNLRAPFLLTGALAPRLADGGRVVNITSTAARLASPDFAAYCVAKAGLEAFTRILAKELAPRRITVNAVSPGYVRTEQVGDVLADPAKVKMLEDSTLFRRLGEPADIADVVHALCTEAGRWVTGQLIEASGGFRM
jgi:NAD(P)-dependent dehydrogenase (short-subunit alcohol dehydrogenase family)